MKPVLTIFLLVTFCFSKSTKGFSQVNVNDSLALVDFYNNTDGPNWKNNSGWLKGPVMTWYGVFGINGRVNWLRTYDNNLNGNLPSSLGNLTALTTLDLHGNNLTGSLPAFFGNLPAIEMISLENNQFSGNIPPELGNASTLKWLYLSNNQLGDSIPSSIGNLSNLSWLTLDVNQITGAIPKSFGNLSNLQFLILNNNHLNGNIPVELGKLSNLLSLHLEQNNFSGRIPTEIGNLKKIEDMHLQHNEFSGELPSSFNNLLTLRLLNIDNNNLNGAIPSLNNLNNLSFGYFGLHNNQFTFEGMEEVDQKFIFAEYSPQANIFIKNQNSILSVSAGGTLSNNTYKWYKDSVLISSNTGDSTLSISSNGKYNVIVNNSIATQLTLYSDTIDINILPINLYTFIATKKQDAIVLNWQTLSESDNSFFAIERSNIGIDFKEIARVDSKGNFNHLQSYNFEDNSPFNGTNYYRLKQVAKDGHFIYSKIAIADFNQSLNLKVYPNPAKDILTIEGLNAAKKSTISIISSTGLTLSKTTASGNVYAWNIKQLTAGTYFVKIESDSKTKTIKFVKQ